MGVFNKSGRIKLSREELCGTELNRGTFDIRVRSGYRRQGLVGCWAIENMVKSY